LIEFGKLIPNWLSNFFSRIKRGSFAIELIQIINKEFGHNEFSITVGPIHGPRIKI
jgi:hypothetical protein